MIALTVALVVAGVPLSASAASLGGISLASFTRASLTADGATLTVSWDAVPGATGYDVFASTSYSGVPAQTVPAARTASTTATLTGLTPNTDYFVQVRATSPGHVGPRSNRVGHGTIAAELSSTSAASGTTHRVLSWNVCSVKCAKFATRKKVIDRRFTELSAGIIGLQEASKYKKAPAGFAFAYNGQNDILYRKSLYTAVTNGTLRAKGSVTFARKHGATGKGVSWAALRSRTTGRFVVVFDVHLKSGTSAAETAQREYEASRIQPYVEQIYRWLNARFAATTTWSAAPAIVLGDVNTNKSRTGDDTQRVLESAGWYDAFDQARSLSGQHRNTANPKKKTTPVIGMTWGDHVDKVLVQPSRAVVLGWSSAGKMARGKYVSPLGSDHHPLLVVLTVA